MSIKSEVIDTLPLSEKQKDSFWEKVDIRRKVKDCWLWTGAKKPSGYGNVRINKKYLLAHRVAFELAHGFIPNGFIVCHVCDNPSCCNPSHLMLGTIKSNAADMVLKGRQKTSDGAARGMENGNSKLNDSDVLEIRSRYKAGGITQCDLADDYGVTQALISSIIVGKTWRHVSG